MTRPEPRPALQKAPDGSMHPAAPRTAATKHLHPAPTAPAVPPSAPNDFRPGDLRARKAASRQGKPEKTKKSERVTVELQLPKKLRKEARRKAADNGWTLDEAVTYVLRAWVDS
jgi:hypothetical protein